MRKQSEATQLKVLKVELRQVKAELSQARLAIHTYRGRATKAETEVAEWRRRFDLLLARSPEGKSGATK